MIPAEAVEAAAKAHHGVMTGGGPSEWGYLDKQSQDNRLYWMRAALEAAAPYMRQAFFLEMNLRAVQDELNTPLQFGKATRGD